MNVRGSVWIGIMVATLPVVALASGKPVVTDYRWRNDNGSESTATWKANPNTPITGVKREENIRVRFAVAVKDVSGSATGTLVYAVGSTNGPWTVVRTAVGAPFQMTATAGYANGDPTTDQLRPPEYSIFKAGHCVEAPASRGATASLNKDTDYSNIEYCFQATVYAQRNTTYYFGLADDEAKAWPHRYYAELTIEDTDPSNPPVDIYVDDEDPNTVQRGQMRLYGYDADGHPITNIVSAWRASTITVGAWSAGSQYSLATEEDDIGLVSFRWIPDVLVAGEYNVYARWTAGQTRGKNVPYAIRNASATNEVFVNQRDQELSGQWNLLGTYTFNAGTNGWVELGGNDGQVCADAIRLERVDGAPLDADGDGMLDSWENTYLGGTNASPTADADLDVMNNLQEFLAGTNPTNSTSVLAVVGLTGTGQNLDLKWLSATGKKYQIDKSTNLSEGFTMLEATNIPADPPTNTHPVTLGAGGSGFYRVRLE